MRNDFFRQVLPKIVQRHVLRLIGGVPRQSYLRIWFLTPNSASSSDDRQFGQHLEIHWPELRLANWQERRVL